MSDWQDVWMSVGQVLSGAALGLAAYLIQKLKYWQKNHHNLDSMLNRNLKIKDLLTEVRVYYAADSCTLFQLHNGNHYASGESMKKLSMTHYVVARGVSAPEGAQTVYQNITATHMDPILTQLLKEPHLLLGTDDFASNDYMGVLMRRSGNAQCLLRAVYDRKHQLIGILVVSWLEVVQLTPAQLDMIDHFTKQMSDELEFIA
jgi:hypothetical protein